MSAHPSGLAPLDLLYVITDLNLGGVPLHLRRLAVAMRDRGMGVAVVSLSPPGAVGDMLRADRLVVHSCEGCCGWDFRVMPRLASLIRELKPRLVHSFLFHANLAAKLAAPAVGFPASRLICEIQTVEVERKWHLRVDRRTFDMCRFTIGNSPSVVDHLAEHAGIPRERLRLVRGGIDVESIRRANPADRRALGLPEDGRLIFWAGRLDPVKGLDVLIRAVAAMNDPRVYLVLAGDGPIRRELQARVNASGLTLRVRFLGPRRDVPSMLQACDVFAFPSRTEGLPNALLEAMAAACAIVATDVPGNRDLIAHGITGLKVPYGDIRALARAIESLLVDQPLRERLGAAALTEAQCRWHVDQTWAAYADLYRDANPPENQLNPFSQAQLVPSDA
jgi:glycosyltransferase involved in cell wall biosynthesis